MQVPNNIANGFGYRPLQPESACARQGVFYAEYPPAAVLREYVYCYWELLRLSPEYPPYRYRIVADGCIDVFCDARTGGNARVMGFQTAWRSFDLNGAFHFAGARFLPGGFPLLFGQDAAELTDLAPEAGALARGLNEALGQAFNIETVGSAGPDTSLLDCFLARRAAQTASAGDPRFGKMLARILRAGGGLQIERDLDEGLSSRQTRRLFSYYAGAPPKQFCRVARFQRALANLSAPGKNQAAGLQLDGYYDQAHMIREFRALYGKTPGQIAR